MDSELQWIASTADWWRLNRLECPRRRRRQRIAWMLNYHPVGRPRFESQELRLAMRTALLMLRQQNELPPNPRRA